MRVDIRIPVSLPSLFPLKKSIRVKLLYQLLQISHMLLRPVNVGGFFFFLILLTVFLHYFGLEEKSAPKDFRDSHRTSKTDAGYHFGEQLKAGGCSINMNMEGFQRSDSPKKGPAVSKNLLREQSTIDEKTTGKGIWSS